MEKNDLPPASTWLLNRQIDRFAALFIAFLSAVFIYRSKFQIGIVYGLFLASQFQIILILLVRRPAKRIETNPWVIVISLLRLFWPLMIFSMGDPKAPHLIDLRITSAVTGVLFCLVIFARMNLGRSLGCFPADRKLVFHGAYAVVRHPIQALEILFFFNFLMACFTWKIAAMAVAGTVVYFIKSETEERFLSYDEDYRKYKEKVRWRFFPYIV